MDLEVPGDLRLDPLEELEELLMPMAAMTGPDDLARRDVEGSEQRGRPVSNVVVRAGLGEIHVHGQQPSCSSSGYMAN